MFHLVATSLHRVSGISTWFHSKSWSEFDQLLLGGTQFYRRLPSFTGFRAMPIVATTAVNLTMARSYSIMSGENDAEGIVRLFCLFFSCSTDERR